MCSCVFDVVRLLSLAASSALSESTLTLCEQTQGYGESSSASESEQLLASPPTSPSHLQAAEGTTDLLNPARPLAAVSLTIPTLFRRLTSIGLKY